MLLPDMFDEKVALMGQEEESGAAEQGRLIALTPGQLVTLFTTGPEGRTAVVPVGVLLDDAKGAAGGKQHYQSARIILHTGEKSDYMRPQLTDSRPERNAAGGTRTRALSSFISNTVRRRPWALGIASVQALPLPRSTVSKMPSMPSTPSGTDVLAKDTERPPDEGDLDSEDGEGGEGGEGGSEHMEGASANGWLGGVSRWASKLWISKRPERVNTPRPRD